MREEPRSNKTNDKLINISNKTFISVLVILFSLVVIAIALTFLLPKGSFGVTSKNGEQTTDYTSYIASKESKGIPIWKGILAPILLLGSSDGIIVAMLCLFLLVISGAFQAMNDNNGIKVIVNRIIARFKAHKFLLLSIISFVFMAFGSLLGLFEEMLTLLPIIAILAVSLGFDSFTGFLISIVASGFGFSSALTNPFTVLFASEIIGVNPMLKIWFRVIVFIVMYGVLELFIYLYIKRIQNKPELSFTYQHDQRIRDNNSNEQTIENEKNIFYSYLVFFVAVLLVLIIFSSIYLIRDYTVVALIVVFLIGGILTSLISTKFNFKLTFSAFGKGILSALPTIVFVLLAASIKYILVEGEVLPTIVHWIDDITTGKNAYTLSLMLFGIILLLEFFISSSTAKAIFVMSILSVLTLPITKETQVLIYTFADGYTNLLFPTSPVLLIGLSMIEFSYFKWLKHSWPLFLVTFTLAIGFVMFAILIAY